MFTLAEGIRVIHYGDRQCGPTSNQGTVTLVLLLFPQDILPGVAVTFGSMLGPSGWQGTDAQSGCFNYVSLFMLIHKKVRKIRKQPGNHKVQPHCLGIRHYLSNQKPDPVSQQGLWALYSLKPATLE